MRDTGRWEKTNRQAKGSVNTLSILYKTVAKFDNLKNRQGRRSIGVQRRWDIV